MPRTLLVFEYRNEQDGLRTAFGISILPETVTGNVKVLAVKLDNLNLILGIHMVEEN